MLNCQRCHLRFSTHYLVDFDLEVRDLTFSYLAYHRLLLHSQRASGVCHTFFENLVDNHSCNHISSISLRLPFDLVPTRQICINHECLSQRHVPTAAFYKDSPSLCSAKALFKIVFTQNLLRDANSFRDEDRRLRSHRIHFPSLRTFWCRNQT